MEGEGREREGSATEEVEQVANEESSGLNCAYEIGVKAYETAQVRLASVNGTTDRLLGVAAALTLAVVALVTKSDSPSTPTTPDLPLLPWLALALFGAGLIVGLWNRMWGRLQLPAPDVLSQQVWWACPEPEFKRDMLVWAGKDWETNRRLINCKGHWNVVVAVLFLLEAAALITWRFAPNWI